MVRSPYTIVVASNVAILALVVLSTTTLGVFPLILKIKLVAVAAVPTFKVPPDIFGTEDTW